MKKIIFFFIYTFISFHLVSCNKGVDYEIGKYTDVYAFNVNEEIIEEVRIEYKITDYIDVFNLYTKYQNYLPQGYISCASPNINLISSYVKNNIVYYEVDNFLFLSKNYEMFVSLLIKENKNLGYINTKLINNDIIIKQNSTKNIIIYC